MSVKKEEYIKRAWNACAIKVCSAVEDQHDDMWTSIEDYIKTAIEEAYDKGHADGYSEGYSDAMNTASYEFDRERGYL